MAITILDGAIGSVLMRKGGDAVCLLNITDVATVAQLHKGYIAAGSDIICTNTFSANNYSKLSHSVSDVVAAGVSIAKDVTEGRAKVALDIGPLSELLEPYGDLTREDCAQQYCEIIAAGVSQCPDYIFFETFMDLEMLELAVKQATPYGLPIMCSMSFTESGKTMMGNSVQQMVQMLSTYPLVAIGLNCSMEPAKSLPVAREFRRYTNLPIIFKPNAGKPQVSEQGVKYEYAELFASEFEGIEELGDVYIGGCCGSTQKHIKMLAEKFK